MADYYRGDLSLRELANRLLDLPAEAGLWHAYAADQEQAEHHQRISDVESALATFKRPKGG